MRKTARVSEIHRLEAVDELFALPPERFTAARDELARTLRSAGQREAATAVKALRRPTRTAWAVNQVARGQPELIERLLEAGAALVREQRRVLSGVRSADIRGPARERRAAVEAAAAAAERHLVESGSDPVSYREALTATFEAGSLGGADGDLLRAGRLTRDLTPPANLGLRGGLQVVELPPEEASSGGGDDAEGGAGVQGRAGKPKRDERSPRQRRLEEAAAKAARKAMELRDVAARAVGESDQARQRAAAAEQELQEARVEEERAAAALAAARAAVAEAEAALARAREQEQEAAAAAERAAEEAAAAETDAEDLAEDARRAARGE